MTHSEIYKKFFIEYDKDMITSSYPSLTLEEVCNFLNKAYLALIAQKFTGNNLRQTSFEGDTKQLEDLQPLVKYNSVGKHCAFHLFALNEISYDVPSDMLYYVDAQYLYKGASSQNVILISHEYAKNFMHTKTNLPWIENPVCTIDNNTINIYYDDYSYSSKDPEDYTLWLKYVKKPVLFDSMNTKDVIFELNDSVVEELINLAITFVLDNVESSRLSSKANLLKLES